MIGIEASVRRVPRLALVERGHWLRLATYVIMGGGQTNPCGNFVCSAVQLANLTGFTTDASAVAAPPNKNMPATIVVASNLRLTIILLSSSPSARTLHHMTRR
jgi:hypothetical protein